MRYYQEVCNIHETMEPKKAWKGGKSLDSWLYFENDYTSSPKTSEVVETFLDTLVIISADVESEFSDTNSKTFGKKQMDVSKNSGTPTSSILRGFSIINHPFWGFPYFWKHPNGMTACFLIILARGYLPRTHLAHGWFWESHQKSMTWNPSTYCPGLGPPKE